MQPLATLRLMARSQTDLPEKLQVAASAHDVARLAGVSQSAVSRAFTDGASISERMRERVLNAAQQLGYRPNVLARSLITRKSKLVGLAMGNVHNPYFTLVLDRLSIRLSEHGYRLLLFTAEMNARVDGQIEELLHYRVDAIILLSAIMSSRLSGECHKAGIPVILFNRTAPRKKGFFSVVGDNEGGARDIARHLVNVGYRNIAFMAGYEASTTGQDRERGFTEYLVEGGLSPPTRVVGDFTSEGAARATRELLSRRKRPEVVFCANDQMACTAVDIARYEFGLEPGKDIGIAGFDDIPMASMRSFSLTTYSHPVDDMALRAVNYVTNLRSLGNSSQTIIPGRLVVRTSTR